MRLHFVISFQATKVFWIFIISEIVVAQDPCNRVCSSRRWVLGSNNGTAVKATAEPHRYSDTERCAYVASYTNLSAEYYPRQIENGSCIGSSQTSCSAGRCVPVLRNVTLLKMTKAPDYCNCDKKKTKKPRKPRNTRETKKTKKTTTTTTPSRNLTILNIVEVEVVVACECRGLSPGFYP